MQTYLVSNKETQQQYLAVPTDTDNGKDSITSNDSHEFDLLL